MMTKRPLGKILALLLVGLPLFAAVTATVDNPAVTRGDPVTLTLSATGDDIRFPALSEIAGYPIQSRGTSRNISIINGRTTRAIEQRLVFTPTEDVAIPALDVTVDGTVEHTLPLHVKVVSPQAAPQGAPVQMLLHLSKEKAYVGEPVELDLVFKYLPGERIDDIRISEPTLEHFWIKRINTQPERAADSAGYITQTYRYLLFPQQSGDLEIPAIFAQIGTQVTTQRGRVMSDPFFNDPFFGSARMQYRKVYSEPATLHVSALPEGLEVYGRFTMRSDVDKTAVDANKPVNLHIHIEGNGNVEDIPKFEPRFEHAIVYANDPKTTSTLKDGAYFGTFDQTIAIIPERDLTITPQAFRYFDAKTAQPTRLQTDSYFIKVKGATAPPPAAVQAAPHVESAIPVATAAEPAASGNGQFGLYEALGIFAAGAAAGVLSLWLLMLRGRDRLPGKRELPPMAKRIKAARSDRALFELLLPLKGSAEAVDAALTLLESNLYRGTDHSVDRQALMAYFSGSAAEDVTFI